MEEVETSMFDEGHVGAQRSRLQSRKQCNGS